MKKIFFNFMLVAVSLSSIVFFSSCDPKESETVTPFETLLKEGILRGEVKGKVALEKREYTLAGPVLVTDGAELTIPAGTVIKAQQGFSSYILVLQGGKIFAEGTATEPIRMTAQEVSGKTLEAGSWGGLVINGRAPLSGNTTNSTEISSEYKYGGDKVDDNSGILKYLILEYTGARASGDIEHNGLTLNGVGNGTTIENIYVPYGADDGIEFFGGSVHVKNLLVLNSDDDMFDFTEGYSGTLENCYGIWEEGYASTEKDPRGVEADGNHDGKYPDQTGQSDFTVKNMTIELKLNPVATDHADFAKKSMQDVIKVRRGAKATVINALVKGSGTVVDIVDFTDGSGAGNPESTISITNKLTTNFTGKDRNGTGVVTFVDTNTGCPANIFAWTGYNF
ncbi:MAG: hypothetical protein LBS07_06430 [Prevotellaceae bacterium]|jgi:hypothetical protein|nr:hypothetical protein [Prevotellaceae bacterium]